MICCWVCYDTCMENKIIPVDDAAPLRREFEHCEYIEQLEKAVLASWYLDEHDRCTHCDGDGKGYWDEGQDVVHKPDCLVPGLLEKYDAL